MRRSGGTCALSLQYSGSLYRLRWSVTPACNEHHDVKAALPSMLMPITVAPEPL